MIGSVRRARVNTHIPKRGRGRRSNLNDGEGSSQTTQSQVDDPTQYLNYQDQVYDTTDGGYDNQQFSDGDNVQQGEDVVPQLDEDDLASQATPKQLPDQPPFPGGPLNISLLSSYALHFALPLWYNANNVSVIFNCIKLFFA